MKKPVIFILFAVVLFYSSCANTYNNVVKSSDALYKYEYAKECFIKGKYTYAVLLLQDVVVPLKGTAQAQESLYLLGLAGYHSKDYESATLYLRKYCSSYPKGDYTEECAYYIGESLYKCVPETQLDQTSTFTAMEAYQSYLEKYVDGKYKEQAQQRLFELQDKIILKEYYNAKLYYNLGTYFGNCTGGGNNYEACVITAQNAIKEFPFSKLREDFAILIMKSKFYLAEQSIESKKLERYRDAEDECYGFLNEYPNSKEKVTAEKFIEECKKHIKD